MAEGHIYVYGVISAEEDKHSKKFGRVGLKEVVEQIHMNKDADLLKVHIRSEGGDVDEGFLIYDALLNTGKIIETIGEGMVASIATVVYLAGSKRTMSANSNFLIHNPWAKGEGTAADFKKNAAELESIETILVNFYAQKTGIDQVLLKELMNKETTLTAEQAKNYGFATELMTTFKAVALFNNQNHIKMTKEELGQEMDVKLDSFFSKFMNLFSKAKALVVTAGDGTMLDFGDAVQEESQITVGSVAKLEDGSAPDGEYVMPNGNVLVFAAGAVTEINEPEGDDEMAKLKEENEALKNELAGVKTQNLSLTASMSDIKKEFTAIKAQIKSDVDSFVKENKVGDKPVNRFEKVFNN